MDESILYSFFEYKKKRSVNDGMQNDEVMRRFIVFNEIPKWPNVALESEGKGEIMWERMIPSFYNLKTVKKIERSRLLKMRIARTYYFIRYHYRNIESPRYAAKNSARHNPNHCLLSSFEPSQRFDSKIKF